MFLKKRLIFFQNIFRRYNIKKEWKKFYVKIKVTPGFIVYFVDDSFKSLNYPHLWEPKIILFVLVSVGFIKQLSLTYSSKGKIKLNLELYLEHHSKTLGVIF